MATLYEKIYGCLAASRAASAMGAVVEGWSPERIRETYGYVDRFYSYLHYSHRGVTWQRPAGTTEDGIERQKLMCRAIIAKGDRITAEDLARTSVEATDLAKMWFTTEPDDQRLMQFMKAGAPAVEVGRLGVWHGLNAVARASHPIGLINAGDPAGAVRDVADIGRLYFVPTDVALVWAGVYDAAIALALRPDATVESVVSGALQFAPEPIKREIDRGIEIVRKFGNYEEMRAEFYKLYSGVGTFYASATASETVTKAFALFVYTKGDPREAILAAVNFGRDTDCLAATAGGLAGALSGIAGVPAEWIEQVDAATAVNPYTNTVCTIKEHADGIYAALKNRARQMRAQLEILEA
jgi:ADP-ribosylglycohydrolase